MVWYLKFNGFFHPLHSKNFFTYRNYHSQGLRQWAGIARGYWKIPERLANSQPLMSGGKADRGGGISQPKRNFPIPPSNACAIEKNKWGTVVCVRESTKHILCSKWGHFDRAKAILKILLASWTFYTIEKGFRSFFAENLRSVGQRTAKLLAIKLYKWFDPGPSRTRRRRLHTLRP